ncbi:hypothetical protein D3C81_1623240 [compost metagenome]
MEVPERAYKTPLLDDFMGYTTQNKWMRALYRSQNYKRHVELKPFRVYAAHGFWYCEAYSILHGENRTFRVDRFVELEEMVDPDIQDIEINRTTSGNDSSIRIIAKLTYRGSLLAEQDTHIGHLVGQISDEEWIIDFECPLSEWNWAKDFFFHLGLDAEVVEPEVLRQELNERATLLASRYKA